MFHTRPTTDSVLTLIEANGDIFFGFISFPTKDFTIQEYEAWLRQYTYNMIPLTQKYPPQIIYHNSIKQFKVFELKMTICSGADFRILLTKLFTLNTSKFYIYEDAITNYFKSFEEPCLTSHSP